MLKIHKNIQNNSEKHTKCHIKTKNKYISYILIDIMKNGRQNSIAKGDDY